VNDFFPPKFKKQNWFIIFNGIDVLEYEFNKFADPPAHPNIIKAWDDNLPIEISFIPDLDLKKLKSGAITSYSYAGTAAAPKETSQPVAKITVATPVANTPTAPEPATPKKTAAFTVFQEQEKAKEDALKKREEELARKREERARKEEEDRIKAEEDAKRKVREARHKEIANMNEDREKARKDDLSKRKKEIEERKAKLKEKQLKELRQKEEAEAEALRKQQEEEEREKREREEWAAQQEAIVKKIRRRSIG